MFRIFIKCSTYVTKFSIVIKKCSMCICQNVQNKNRSKNLSDIVNQMLQYGPLNSKTDKKVRKKKSLKGSVGRPSRHAHVWNSLLLTHRGLERATISEYFFGSPRKCHFWWASSVPLGALSRRHVSCSGRSIRSLFYFSVRFRLLDFFFGCPPVFLGFEKKSKFIFAQNCEFFSFFQR
jgi:hypothetical protein